MNIDTDTLQTASDELATERYERATEWNRLQSEVRDQLRALLVTLERIEELEELGV